MANVRYSGGGTSATLGTKTIDENGIYNASSDDLDGYSQVTVEVPQPSGDLAMTLTENAVYDGVDVKDYASATITVDVPVPPEPQTQSKSITANITQQTVTPDTGYTLSSVIVNPQRHDLTFTPNSNTASNDMGQIHDYRYVDTSGMIEPSGTKSVTYDSNGSHSEDVSQYANISVEVDVPVSGDLGTKTIIANGTYTALDDNLDGYSEVEVNVPQNATLGIKSITANGNYNAITDGYDGYSRVSVSVPGAALQSSKTVTATTSQQTVTPDVGYDGLEQVIVDPQVHTQTYTPAANMAANDMGAQNNYRYVNTSGMITPSGTKSITANGTGIDVTAYAAVDVAVPTVTPTNITPDNISPVELTANQAVKPTSPGYAIASYNSITPSDSSPVIISPPYLYKPTENGIVYRNPQAHVKTGDFTLNTSSNTYVNLGFKPKYLVIISIHNNVAQTLNIYNEDALGSSYAAYSGASTSLTKYSLPSTNNFRIDSITSTGFIMTKTNSTYAADTYYYFAIG